VTEASLDTKRYLENIGSRVRAYHNTINRAKEYVLENEIHEHPIVMNCIIMSILWLSSVRGEELSEEELFMFLGLEDELAENKTVQISPDMRTWGLEEVLEYVVKNY
jgi:hypothetical protein